MCARPSRRSFLRGAGGAALAATAGCLTRVGPWRQVRVPTLLAGDEVVHSRQVPKTWVEHVEVVETARRKLGEIAWEFDGVTTLKVTRSDVRYGGRPGLGLAVELSRPEGEIHLPDEIDGVPVRLESGRERGLSACYNDRDFDPIPGGVVVEPTEGDAFGTACCRVSDEGDDRLLTAAHLWRSCRGGVDVGAPAYQSGRRIGRIARYDTAMDVALIEPLDGVDFDGTIKLERPTHRAVEGVVSDWGLAVLVTGEQEVENVGASSGYTSGVLTAKDVDEGWNRCVDFAGRGVEAEYRNVVGDSGGPVFHSRDGDAYLVALQQMWVERVGTDCSSQIAGDRGRGTAANRVRERLGVRFASGAA